MFNLCIMRGAQETAGVSADGALDGSVVGDV